MEKSEQPNNAPAAPIIHIAMQSDLREGKRASMVTAPFFLRRSMIIRKKLYHWPTIFHGYAVVLRCCALSYSDETLSHPVKRFLQISCMVARGKA